MLLGSNALGLYDMILGAFISFTVVQVQEWLGHSSAATTLNFYAHVDKTSKLNISRTLNTKLEIKI